MNDTKLKPCPLCSEKDIEKRITMDNLKKASCPSCGLIMYRLTWEKLEKSWNTRKPMDDIVERLEVSKEYSNPYDSYWQQGKYFARECEIQVVNKTIDKVISIVKEVMQDE